MVFNVAQSGVTGQVEEKSELCCLFITSFEKNFIPDSSAQMQM